jgi:hypothetical protein
LVFPFFSLSICLFKYEQRKNSNNKDIDLDVLLKGIKTEIDSLLKEPVYQSSSSSDSGSNLVIVNNQPSLTTTTATGGSSRIATTTTMYDNYFNNDMKILIETYEKCSKKVNELSEKSILKDEYTKLEKEFNSDLECLEMKLKYLNEKLTQLKSVEKKPVHKTNTEYVDKLINQHQVRRDLLYSFYVSKYTTQHFMKRAETRLS